jgi:hypothetical protein
MVDYTNNIEYDYNIEHLFKHCRDTIIKLKRLKVFYIGSTVDPEETLQHCINTKKMKNMVILCTLPNKCETENLMDLLLTRFKKQNKCKNFELDIEKEEIKDEVNHVYVLFK